MSRFSLNLIGAMAAAFLAIAPAAAVPEIGIRVDGPQGLRLAFVKAGGDWQPVCVFPADQTKPWTCRSQPAQWFVRYRGKQIGTVSAKGWADTQSDPGIGLLKIASGAAPHIGARDKSFSGWLDKPVYRPLVATNTALPDRAPDWIASKPQPSDIAAALPFLRKQVPIVPDCGTDGEPSGKGRPLEMAEAVIAQTWRNGSGASFFGMSLKPNLVARCNFTADALEDVWIYSDASGARALPALIEDEATHAFIDIGDFAGDGGEEALFALAGYNEDGFVLYYDGFRKSARISWHYH
jgi:hypothetical protein